jgi:signal transduction histidine kinase
VLHIEDDPNDSKVVENELRRGGFTPALHRVETEAGLKQALSEQSFDLAISDYALTEFGALAALEVLRSTPSTHLPFILFSGSMGEERAVEALKAGSDHIIFKQNPERLVPAIKRELESFRSRRGYALTIERLKEAVSARDEFLSIVSHELKTPLTSLKLQVQILMRAARGMQLDGRLGPAELLDKLGAVSRGTDRLTRLVGRLLDITQVTGGRMLLQRSDFDLVDLVNEVVEGLDELAAVTGVVVAIESPDEVVGKWDRRWLASMIGNLLENALKYGQSKPVTVRIHDNDQSVSFAVQDQGIGIAPEDQVRVFERFERAVTDQHYGGFGLGLWLSRLIVEAHGGTIHVQSHTGQGSLFQVELPRVPVPSLGIPEQERRSSSNS